MVTSRAEREFHAEMGRSVQRMHKEISYKPTVFIAMMANYGGAEAARRLLVGRDPSHGFTVLWETNRLELSVEATALLPWYAELFTSRHLELARTRLEAHGFDVKAFLDRRLQAPPGWAVQQTDGRTRCGNCIG